MITNSDVLKVRNRSMIILIAGIVFFVIAGIIGIAYSQENAKIETMDKLNSKKNDKYSLKAKTAAIMLSDPIEFGNDKKMAYYIVYNGKNYNVVYLAKDEYTKLSKKDLEKEPAELVGQSTMISNDLKKKILELYNKNIPYESEEYLVLKDFDKVFGSIYLDTTKTKSENALLLISFIWVFIGLGVLTIIFSIIKLTLFNKKIKKFDETDYGFMELEMEELETTKYPKYNLFLTSHYVIWLTNLFNACKYEDIVWMYPNQKNNKTIGLKILTKNSETFKILTIKGTPNNDDNIAIQDVWNKIYQKNHNIALGYTPENIERFSVKK